jgi:hypothetical protein
MEKENIEYKLHTEYAGLAVLGMAKTLLVMTPNSDKAAEQGKTYHLVVGGGLASGYLSELFEDFLCSEGIEVKKEDDRFTYARPLYRTTFPDYEVVNAVEPEREDYKLIATGDLHFDRENQIVHVCPHPSSTYSKDGEQYGFKEEHLPILEKIIGMECELR